MNYKEDPIIIKEDVDPDKIVSFQIRTYAEELIKITEKGDLLDIFITLNKIRPMYMNVQFRDSIESAGLLDIPYYDTIIDLLEYPDLQIVLIVIEILKKTFMLNTVPLVLDFLRAKSFIEKTIELVNKEISSLTRNVIELYSELVSDEYTYEYITEVFTFPQMDEIISTTEDDYQPVRFALACYIYKVSTLGITDESSTIELGIRAQQMLHNFPNEQYEEKLIWTLINVLQQYPEATAAQVDIPTAIQELDKNITKFRDFTLTGTIKLIADALRLDCPFRPSNYTPYLDIMKNNNILEPNAIAICAILLTEFALNELRSQSSGEFYVEGFVKNVIELFFAHIDSPSKIKNTTSCGIFQILTLYLPMHERPYEFVAESGLFGFIDKIAETEEFYVWDALFNMLIAIFSRASTDGTIEDMKALFFENSVEKIIDEFVETCDNQGLIDKIEEFKFNFFGDNETEGEK